MLVRKLGVGVDERRRHHEVLGDEVGRFLRERLQLHARDIVEVTRRNGVGNLGVGVLGADRAEFLGTRRL